MSLIDGTPGVYAARALNRGQSLFGSALTMGAANSNRIECGNPAILTDVSPGTICAWVYNTNTATNQRLWAKGTVANLHHFRLNSSNFGFIINRSTALQVETAASNFAVYATNKWFFIVAQWDTAGANSDQKLWMGDLVTKPAEPSSYSVNQTVGSGAVPTDAGTTFCIGNASAANTVSWVGRYAAFGMWNKLLSYAEIFQQWNLGRQYGGLMSPTPGCINMVFPGFIGTGDQWDWSGYVNTGIVTGATYTPFGVPMKTAPEFHRRFGLPGAAPTGRIFKLAGEGGGLAGPSRGLAAQRVI